MKRFHALFAAWTVLALAFAHMASAQDWFVTTNGSGDGSSWASPTNSIQGAINAAAVGVTVWVSNGVYDTGGITNYPTGSLLTNRVAITKAITVRSANNDPTNTIIKGSSPDGPAAVRCVWMAANSQLIGFTLTNGATKEGWGADEYGGGVRASAASSIVSNCIIVNNSCWGYGGGACWGTLYNCTLSGNFGYWYGGGASYSVLYNCTLSNNTTYSAGGGARECTLYNCLLTYNRAIAQARQGGGSSYGALYNCLLTGNTAESGSGGGACGAALYNCTLVGNAASSGGGAFGGTLANCIVYFNNATSGNGSNWYSTVNFTNCCTMPTNDLPGTGNIMSDPMFIDNGSNYGLALVAGNYRFATSRSPCVNTGTNMLWMTNSWGRLDLDGNLRIHIQYGAVNGIVDMGAYEFCRPRGSTYVGR